MTHYTTLTDKSTMPYGQHKGKRMVDVPADYLLFLLDNNKCSGSVRNYIEDNIQVLRQQAKK